MASNTHSIERIIKMFNDLSFRHKMINSFSYGPTSDINSDGNLKMPYLHIENTNTTMSRGGSALNYTEVYYDFDVYVMDRINKGDDNYINTTSDTLYILQTIISEISQHPYYVAAGLKLVDDIQTQAVFEATDENVNGHRTTIRLKQALRFTPCTIPISEIPGWTFSLNGSTLEYRLDCGCDGGTGSVGPQGPIGNTGSNGSNGLDGSTGPQGDIGPQGADGSSTTSYYISLSDYNNHIGSTAGSYLTFSTELLSNGITYNGSQIIIQADGIYNINYALQSDITIGTSSHDTIITVFLVKGASPIDDSYRRWQPGDGLNSLNSNFLLDLRAGVRLELYWEIQYIGSRPTDSVSLVNGDSGRLPSMILNIMSV